MQLYDRVSHDDEASEFENVEYEFEGGLEPFTFRDLREATVSSIVKELDSPLIIKDIDRR